MLSRRTQHLSLAFIAAAALAGAALHLASASPGAPSPLPPPAPAVSVPKAEKKIRVLVAPGHEPKEGGAFIGQLRERDIVVELGKELGRLLEADGRFEAQLTRDERGWTPELAEYFSANWEQIDQWRQSASDQMRARIAGGELEKPVVHISHKRVADDVAIRLYGITKWGNDNDVDVSVHLHFEDERALTRSVGRRTGFAIYVPTPEYANAAAARVIAEKVKARLGAFDPVADLATVAKAGGIVDDPQLIAVGKNDTSEAPSLLIEYGFIYEQRLKTPAVRALVLRDLAYQTYLALEDHFFGAQAAPGRASTSILPHEWKLPITIGAVSPDVYALQTALTIEGVFPPPRRTGNACPRTGTFDECTRLSLTEFQKKYGITGESGRFGKATMAELTRRFSATMNAVNK